MEKALKPHIISIKFLLKIGMMNLIHLTGSYAISNIQDYFVFINKNNMKETITNNPPVQIYVNRIKNRIVLKSKTGYKIELLSLKTIKLLGSTKKMLIKIRMLRMYQN